MWATKSRATPRQEIYGRGGGGETSVVVALVRPLEPSVSHLPCMTCDGLDMAAFCGETSAPALSPFLNGTSVQANFLETAHSPSLLPLGCLYHWSK